MFVLYTSPDQTNLKRFLSYETGYSNFKLICNNMHVSKFLCPGNKAYYRNSG